MSIHNSVLGITIKNSSIILENKSNSLSVYFIDIGQGDSILIHTQENRFILIDTGSRTYSSTLINFLNNLNVHTLEAFIATHPHEDHIGNAQEIFDTYNVLNVYHPGYYQTSATYQRFIQAAESEGCPIYTDDQLDPGDYIYLGSGLSCQILNINKDASNANDASIVLRLDYGAVSFLFTGDINGEIGDYAEINITDNFNVDIDILKVAHHGSRHASTDYFLFEATPEISIISCGKGNSYGHPHPETVNRLTEHNSLLFRTDQNGNIKITTDGYTWNVYYEEPEEKPIKPIITGSKQGITGLTYTFTAKSFDPNGDALFYLWDWNDGNVSQWDGPYIPGQESYAAHKWIKDGAYVVRVKAKDMFDHESEWSYFTVSMPKNKLSFSPINRFIIYYHLQKFINHF